MSEHTPEPWKLDTDSENTVLGGVEQAEIMKACGMYTAMATDRANARRIVACVNACAGIPTEYLEVEMVKKMDAPRHVPDPSDDYRLGTCYAIPETCHKCDAIYYSDGRTAWCSNERCEEFKKPVTIETINSKRKEVCP